MSESEGKQIPVHVEGAGTGEEDRGWREVADRWRQVGRRVRDLSERLATAFRTGWEVEELAGSEARGVADQLRALGERMERAVDSVKDEARKPDTKTHARETMSETKEASRELFQELEETLNEGLEDLNRRVDEVLEKRKREDADEASSA